MCVIYPLRANYTHATTPYGIGTYSDNQLRKNNATAFFINKSTELRIPIPKDRTRTVKDQNPTQPSPMLILPLITHRQPPAKLATLKVQEPVGSNEIALRTDSARESTGYGQEQNF